MGPTTLSLVEIDRYSVRKRIIDELTTAGWTLPIELVKDNWPDGVAISVPGIYIKTEDNENQGLELGAYGMRREFFVHIYGANDADRWRLSEFLLDIFRRLIPIYEWEDGTETDPDEIGLMDTDEVNFRTIDPLTTTPDAQRWRSVVHATLLRNES